MKIGLNGRFLSARTTGVQRFAREVSKRLLQRTDCVLLLANSTLPDSLPPGTRYTMGKLRGHAWEQLELPAQARGAGCNVVLHLPGTMPASGGPNVAMVHDVLPITNPEWFSRRFATWYRYAVGRNARRAARILTVSAWSATQIVRTLRLKPELVQVVPQGLSPFDRPATDEEVTRVRSRFQLPERYVLSLGWGDRRKNVQFLLQVMESWAATDTELPALVVAGGASTRVHGKPRLAPWDPRLKFLGHVEDEELRALYTGARVFCFPSLAEGFGRPPLEAMACGTPAIAAPYGPAREVLGDEAFIVPLEPDAWVAALRTLDHDESARRRMLENAARRRERFDWDAATAGVLEACVQAAHARVPAVSL